MYDSHSGIWCDSCETDRHEDQPLLREEEERQSSRSQDEYHNVGSHVGKGRRGPSYLCNKRRDSSEHEREKE